jgi:hypothetical protein
MFTPNEPLTYLDRMVAYVAPSWALRRARDRRTLYLEARRDLGHVRWIDGEPYTCTATGEWVRVPTTERFHVAPPPMWRPSTFWQRPREPAPSRWTQVAPTPDPTQPPGFRRMP